MVSHAIREEDAMNENANAAKIRALNDQFRKTDRGGRIMLTQGIQAMGQRAGNRGRARLAADSPTWCRLVLL
jgi:hypothetical protein